MPTTAIRELTFNQAINDAIRLEMRRDPAIVVLGEDIAGGAGRAHLGLWMPGAGRCAPPRG